MVFDFWNRPKSVHELAKPERLDIMLKKDSGDDCLPCRAIGTAAFVGLGAYSYFSGHSQLRAQQAKILQSKSIFGMKSRQAGITTISLSLIGLGLYRMVN